MSWIDDWRNRRAAVDEDPSDPAMERLLQRARALPSEVEPPRDLFAGIANRINDPSLELSPPPRRAAWASLFPRPLAASALASGLVALSVMTTLWVTQPSGPPSDARISEIASTLRERDGVSDVHEKVVAILATHRVDLPPETVEAIEDNLQSIDRAIAEIHFALEANPGENALNYLLAEAYRREADLLERLESWTAFEKVRS